MLIAMLLGFRHFFFQGRAHPGRDLTPEIRSFVILHGAAMTGWVVVFVIQTFLIAARRRRTHKMLGQIAAALAVFLVASGLWFNLASFRLAPPDFVLWSLKMKQFMLLGFYSLFMFAGFVAVGLIFRGKPEVHRPMMLLATLSTMPPAIARIDVFNALYQGTTLERVFGPFLGTLTLGAIFLMVNWRLSGTIDRTYTMGYGVLACTQLLIMQLARTPMWDQFASFLLR
jgi:hypothetical protein